jgi:hypothetical protein
MAANYEAFRRRRSLLLLNLEHQVRVEELPWVHAVEPHRRGAADSARAAVSRLAELALDAFPATLVPNNLVTELDALAREAGLELPLVEELAADIFMGTFSSKFVRAAQLAGRQLSGSLYERYYGIDYAAVLAIDDLQRVRRSSAKTSPTFDALCLDRAGPRTDRFSVAANGKVIEQAQILSTQNLAALTELDLTLDWAALAGRCYARIERLADGLDGTDRPLHRVKDLAYAWRHMVFFLARLEPAEQRAFVAGLPPDERLRPAVAGLAQTIDGAAPERVVLGWTLGPHWLLTPA